MSIAFSLLQHHILFARAHLLRGEMSLEHRRRLFRRTQTGLVPYLVATALAPLSAYVTLAICAALAVFYALPNAAVVPEPRLSGREHAVGVGAAGGQEREQLEPVAALVEIEIGDEHRRLGRAAPARAPGRTGRR